MLDLYKPLVSIIIAAYNEEKYICESIDSIYKSSYPNFEVICIDDGSTDRTGELCKAYSEKFSNFFYFKHENAGLAFSRNIGLRKAKGEFITFVDADDCIHENMVEYLITQICKFKADIAYTKLHEFTRKLDYSEKKNKNNQEVEVCLAKEALIKYFNSNRGNVCGGVFKKSLFLGIKFPDGLIYEDNVVKTYLLIQSNKTVFSNTYFYFYRVNRNSITRRTSSVKNLDVLKIGYIQQKILKQYFKTQYRNVKRYYYQMISGMLFSVIKRLQIDNIKHKIKISEYVPLSFFLKLIVYGLITETNGRISYIKKIFKIFKLN